MKAFEWDMTDRWRSNDGKGPLTARILSVSRGIVSLEYWRTKDGGRTRTRLTEKYFMSERCGWKRVPAPDPEARREKEEG